MRCDVWRGRAWRCLARTFIINLPLSPRQTDALEFIRAFIAEHDYPPTIREVSVSMEINVHAADCHIRALEKKGRIARTPHVARSIVVLGD